MAEKTALLDLDGTLLPMEIDDFLNAYFKLLTDEFSSIFEAEQFINNLMYATKQMINNNGEKINSEIFIEEFFDLFQVDNQQEIMEKFDLFYKERFPLLKSQVNHKGLSSCLVEILKENGYDLVLATNPIFPAEAIKERLRWVNINPKDFSLITNYENMHYCKPNINYYKEIVELLNLKATGCIMVGNDVQEDMVAADLGMKTYLVTDFLIDRNEDEKKIHWQGSMEELIKHFSER